MAQQRHTQMMSGPFGMILSGIIFGYFGFFMFQWNPIASNGDYLLFIALCEWTLKIASIGMFASAVLTIAHAIAGNVLYSLLGLGSAVMFVIIAVLDIMDKQYAIGPHMPFLLFIFAAWNGFSSCSSLMEIWRTFGSRESDPAT